MAVTSSKGFGHFIPNYRSQTISPCHSHYETDYLGIAKNADNIFIQITLNAVRTVELKQTFREAVVDKLVASMQMSIELTITWCPCFRRQV